MNEYMRMADRMYDLENQMKQLEKENAELKEKNEKSNVLLADIIEAFTSCSYNDDFEMAQAGREIYELFNGGKAPKEVFHNAEVPKSSRQLLKEAKEIIKIFLCYEHGEAIIEQWSVFLNKAEQFLKECE